MKKQANERTFQGILLNVISEIIEENKDKRVWLIVNGGSLKILFTIHVRPDFLKFLSLNEDKIVYKSSDGISKVLLFSNDN